MWASLWILNVAITPFFSSTSVSAANPIVIAGNAEWPNQALSMRYNPSHNAVWGTAIDSDINWTFDTHGDKPFTDVIVVNGVAYFGSMNNRIYALNAVTGQKLWEFTANNWIMTDPVIADGKLFAGSGNRFFQNKHLRGTGPNSLYALDAKTGQKLWEYAVPGEAMPTPVYNNGTVYFTTGDRTMYALNADTGKLKFKIQTASYFSMSSPALDNNLLFVGGAKPFAMYAFDVTNQKLAWQHIFSDVYLGMDDCSPALDNNTLFTEGITDSDTNGTNPPPRAELLALDEQTGAVKWNFNMGPGLLIDDNKCGTPVVKNGIVYASSPVTKKFYAVSEATGQLLWSYNIGASSRGASIILDNYLILGDMQGNIQVLELANGKLIGKKSLGGSFSPDGPSLFNGTIYAANQNGKVYAFSLFSVIKSSLLSPRPATLPVQVNTVYFPQTGHTLSGSFLPYWQQQGGLSQYGYPITEPFQQFQMETGQTYLVQYFERARFELHPELTTASNQIELGLLGTTAIKTRLQEKPFIPLSQAPPTVNGTTSLFFKPTEHSLSGDFLKYWQANGGLARYGYPLSEPFREVSSTDGKSYTVQYFERARFELHPELVGAAYPVELGQLGHQVLAKAP